MPQYDPVRLNTSPVLPLLVHWVFCYLCACQDDLRRRHERQGRRSADSLLRALPRLSAVSNTTKAITLALATTHGVLGRESED
ncbi:hypothetical protein PF008_g27731 [Phytophthora fragariae]|uniref:Uncharacterized protein n=1 Tax=Phytophthora fragariae TaxID=53985 RepID=A0A6G0QDB6_9STRA|nr:hypothetical protein PF008_g27731 [Phytophthora fragariae]